MGPWVQLLVTSLLVGAGLVWAMILPRRAAPLLLAASVVGLLGAISAVGAIAQRYQTPEAFGAAVFFLIAGSASGYALAAAALPLLAYRPRAGSRATTGTAVSEAVVLLACTDPDRYSPRAVATQGADLERGGAVDVPLVAVPFVYLAERTRYHAIGGHSPGAVLTAELRTAVMEVLADTSPPIDVRLAWTYARPSLAEVVATCAADGIRSVAVVVLGAEDSDAVDRAKTELDADCAGPDGPQTVMSESLWRDRALPDRLVERILETIGDAERAGAGVLLVCAGQPVATQGAHRAAAEDDTYFNERVRMLLAETGFDERLIRAAWLEWQQPDVTEAARHLAALGCTRLVVAPTTIAIPTVSTALDLKHAIDLARLPASLAVSVLPPWGSDAGMVHAVARSATRALDAARRRSGP